MKKEPNAAEMKILNEASALISNEALQLFNDADQDVKMWAGWKPEALPMFQELTSQLATLVKSQGQKKTSDIVCDLAREIRGFGDSGFNDPNKLSDAFGRAISKISPIVSQRQNPFAGPKNQ